MSKDKYLAEKAKMKELKAAYVAEQDVEKKAELKKAVIASKAKVNAIKDQLSAEKSQKNAKPEPKKA